MNTTVKVPIHKESLSLTGKPLNPNIISERELRTNEQMRIMKQKKSFFNVISQKFSEASKWHFKDNLNPTRKIKTSHLRVKSMRQNNEKDYHQGKNYKIFNSKLYLFFINIL